VRKLLRIWLVPSTLFLASIVGLRAQGKESLHLVQTIPMPNVKGRIDHMDVDVKGKRLFVAGLENGSLEVIDLQAGKWSKSIPGFKKPQGIAYVPSLNKLFVASGDDGMLRVFRGDTLELLDAIKLDIGRNRVTYDPRTKLLYVGYGGKDAGKDYGEVGISTPRRTSILATSRWRSTPRSYCSTSREGPCSSLYPPQAKFKSWIRRNANWCPHGPSAASATVTVPWTRKRTGCSSEPVRPRE
jgi:DNA-binding beta-propeller fold protein YncE